MPLSRTRQTSFAIRSDTSRGIERSASHIASAAILSFSAPPLRITLSADMHSNLRVASLVVLLAMATSALYFWRLDDTPTLTRDEAFVSLSGHSVTATGRDLEGRRLPLYFRSRIDGTWWSPMLPYVIAGALKVLPLSEGTVRAPMALAAVINVVLVFFIGRLLFARESLALVPAALLALSPVQLIENRYANDPGVPATFALAWMLAALLYLRTGHARALVAAGIALGVGVYSYIGGVPLMPLYLALTYVALWRRRDRWTRYLMLTVSFAIPIALGVPWLALHPDAVRYNFLHYQSDPHVVDLSTAFSLFASLRRVVQMGSLYLKFWDPRFLFVRGADVLRHSTGHVGVYLVSAAGLIAIGLVRAARRTISDSRSLLLLGGFLLAPLPSCLVDFNDHLAAHAIWRAVEVLSFGALLAGLGLEYLLTEMNTRPRLLALGAALGIPLALAVFGGPAFPHGRALLIGLVVPPVIAIGLGLRAPRSPDRASLAMRGVLCALAFVSLLQYGSFYADYMTDYKARSTVETDGNMRGLLETVIALSPVIAPSQNKPLTWIYLGFRLGPADWGGNYWRFYVHKHHREDLLTRTINDENASQFNYRQICLMPPGSLLTTRVGWDAATDALIDQMIAKGELTREGAVGWPIYWLMRKTESCSLS
jgi:4-amino-4-deoxy-L-arabinose transferase-like glycosyltransferase